MPFGIWAVVIPAHEAFLDSYTKGQKHGFKVMAKFLDKRGAKKN
jgi:hypothetical protein